jgi:hypothetical protein
MSIKRNPSITQTRERLRTSRAEFLAVARQMKGDGDGDGEGEGEDRPENTHFPRSAIMRALLGDGGRALWGGAALGLGMWGPRWIRTLWRLAPLTPLLRGALNRYLMRRIFR